MGTIKPFGNESMLSVLQSANSILLCTHRSPDGDAIGSMLAMGLALREMGRQVTMACHDPVPGKMLFLPGAEDIVGADALDGCQFDAALALDAAELSRLGDCADAFSRCPETMQLDHHGGNPHYARHNEVDAEAGATGVMVFRLLRAMNASVTPAMAQCLYCAISLDTGNFCFSCTTAEAFAIMAALMDAGLALSENARLLHLLREEAHVRLLGRALDSLRVFGQGQCAGMHLTAMDFSECQARPEHASKIVNYGMDIPGVKIAYLLEESEPGIIKGSLRAQPPYDVAAVARSYGGGGHTLAAGFRTAGSIDALSRQLERELLRALEEKA